MGLKKRKLLFDTEYFQHYYLCTYIPKGAGSDKLSQSLVNFKNGIQPHQQAWAECALEEMQNVLELKQCYVIRALAHEELTHDSKNHPAITSLTSKVCKAVRGNYIPTFLEKIRSNQKLSLLSKADREREISSVYRFHSPERNPKHILIVDDIMTSGATIKAIIAAILKEAPSITISIFTLAFTDGTGNNDAVELSGKHYRWITNDRWMVVAEDSPDYAATLAHLKEAILNDKFD